MVVPQKADDGYMFMLCDLRSPGYESLSGWETAGFGIQSRRFYSAYVMWI